MRLTRTRKSLAVTFVLVLGPSIACATREDLPADPPGVPDPGSSIEAGAVDAHDDGPATASGCSTSGFCSVRVPSQSPLLAVSASSADDAWMLAEQSGALLRWDGTALKEVYDYGGDAPSSIAFAGIWAQKKDDVWAVANDNDDHLFVVRYAPPIGGGAPAFRELPTEEPWSASLALWAAPAGDALWVATDQHVLRVHEDASGAVVERLDPTAGAGDGVQYTWHGVWGFGASDVYVAGSACSLAACEPYELRGVIAHYDGAAWSMRTIDSAAEVLSLHGTPPGGERQLWYHCREQREVGPGNFKATVKTYLAALTAEGQLGPPVYSHSTEDAPACTSRVGHATAPGAGWFSDGLLLCRWTGAVFEPAITSIGGRPSVFRVNGIWAGGADDVWIVGAGLAGTNMPQGPFAARRTATTAKGGQP